MDSSSFFWLQVKSSPGFCVMAVTMRTWLMKICSCTSSCFNMLILLNLFPCSFAISFSCTERTLLVLQIQVQKFKENIAKDLTDSVPR